MNSAVLAEENATLKATLAQREARIERLEFDLERLRILLFGARSERLQTLPGSGQMGLWDEVPDDNPLVSPVEFKTVVKSPAKNAPKRTALPEHLPREIVVLPLSAEDRQCPECGEERPVIGYESSERLDYVPAQLKVIETRREKCACSKCQGQLTTVPAPPHIIEQGIPLPGLLAHLLMAKYDFHRAPRTCAFQGRRSMVLH